MKSLHRQVSTGLHQSHNGGKDDEVARLFQLAPAIQTSFPNIDALGNLVAIERQLGLQAQSVARAQPAGQNAEFRAGCEHLIPHALASALVGRDIDFEAVLAGVAGARDHHIGQSANRAEDEGVRPHLRQFGISQFLQR